MIESNERSVIFLDSLSSFGALSLGDNCALFMGDMFDVLPVIPRNSIDLVFCDLPYGKTSNDWDRPVNLEKLWAYLKVITSPHTPVVFTASGGYEFEVYNSSPKLYKYKWVWNKNNSAGFATAKIRPLQVTEDVLVFCTRTGESIRYYPQMEKRGKPRKKGGYSGSSNYCNLTPTISHNNVYYPKNILNFGNQSRKGKYHPTQKPVELVRYIVETYTKQGDIVLDPAMGSGTVGEVCQELGRGFVGMEMNEDYFSFAVCRIAATQQSMLDGDI